eukprot:g32209.t1
METFDWDALDGQERTQAEDDELAQGEAQLRALLLRARPKWSSRELLGRRINPVGTGGNRCWWHEWWRFGGEEW